MANLGTLMFGADIDLKKLKDNIEKAKGDIAEALKMTFKPEIIVNSAELKSIAESINANADAHQKSAKSASQEAEAKKKVATATNETTQATNAEVAAQQKVLQTSQQIEATEKRIAELKEKIAKNEATIKNMVGPGKSGLAETIATEKQQLESLERTLTDLNNKQVQNEKALADATRARVSTITQNTTEKNKNASATTHLTAAEQQLAASIKSSTSSMHSQSQVLSDLKSLATQYLGVWGAQAFIHNIIEIGGQLEMQRLSIGAILGDMAKADDLFGKIKNLAIKSPFGVVELDQMTKQLSAYGFEYNELFDMTKRLADISAATGTSVDRLALALGHVRSEAALSGYTLRQFSMANIPLAKKLSEHLTEVEGKLVSIADVRKRVRSKDIGYQEVLNVLKELTDEGGMFYNAQEIMSESVKAKFKNLKDSMDIMYGEMADSFVGKSLKEIASLLTTLTRHWQELGAVLVTGAGYWMLTRTSMSAVSKAMVEGNIAAGKFSAAQLEMAAHTGNLTKQMLLQAVATHKLSVAEAEAAGNVFLLSKAQLQHVANTGKVASAMNIATIATSKYTVAQLRLFAMMRNLSLFNISGFFSGIASGAKAAGAALLGLGKSLLPLLAISAVVEIFTSLKREQEEYAESANYVGQQARNMMKDIDEAINSIEKNGKPLDTEALREAVKTMQDVVEQNEFYTAEQQRQVDGAKTLSDKYDVLLKQMREMREEAAFLANSEDLFAKIIENTGKNIAKSTIGTWDELTGKMTYSEQKTWGLPFGNDSIKENLEEVNKANSQLQTAIQLMAEYQGVMDEAIKKNNGFGLSLDGKSWQEQIRLIAESGHWDEFVASVENAGSRFEKQADKVKKASDNVRDKWAEIVNDDFEAIKLTLMDHFNMTEKELDDWAKNNEKTVRWMVDGVVKAMSKFGIAEAVLDSLKQKILNFFNYGSNGKPNTKEPSVYDLQTNLGKQIISNVLKHNKLTGKGSAYNLSVKDVNALTGTGDAEKTVSEVVKAIKDRAQKDYQVLKDTEKIYDKNSKQYAAAKKKYEYSLNLAESNGIDKSEIEKEKGKGKGKGNSTNKALAQAEKDAKARTKMAEAQLKIDEELAKQRLELEDAIADAEVAAIKNNSARERAQRLNEMRKQERDLKKQVEEWKKTAFKALKEKYEADPNNKKVSFYDTPEGKAGWQGVPLTKEQEETYKQRWATMLATGEKSLKELVRAEHKANADAIQKYIEQFGTYEEKKKAIYEKANDEICDLQEQLTDDMTDEERQAIDAQIALVKKGAQDQVDELEVQYGKAKAFMIDLFEDVSEKSIKSLEKIIKKYEALRDFLKGEKNVTRSDLNLLGFSEKDIDKALEEYGKNPTDFLKKFLDRLKGVKKELKDKSIWKQFSLDFEEIQKSTEGEGYKIEKMAEIAEQAIPIFAELGENMLAAFGIDDTGIKAATKSLQSLVGVVKGIGQIKSGDKLGGILSIASSVISVGTTFADYIRQNHNDEHRRILERVDRRLETTNERLTELNETISKSYGIEASAAADEAREQAELKRQQAWEALKKSSLVKEAKYDGQWYNVLAYIFEKFFGLDAGKVKNNFEGGMWEYIFAHNTEEEILAAFRKAREENSDVWAMLTVDPKVKEYIEMLLDLPETVDQINEAERKSIIGMSFDDVKEDFLENLYAMADGSETVFDDIDNNWQKMLNRMVVNNLVYNKFQGQLEDWYKRLSELQRKYNQGEISTKDYKDELNGFLDEYHDMSSDAQLKIKWFRENGITKPIGESTSSAETAFKDLRSSFLDTLMDMEGDAEDFRKKMEEIMVKDVIEKNVFSKAFEIGDQPYKNLDEYITKWNERYADAVAANDTLLIDQLLDELVKVRELTIKEAETLRERLKDIDTTFSGLSDSWVSTLMDMSKTAEDWAEDIGRTMAEKIIKEMVVPTMLQPLLDDLQSVFNTTLANATTTDADGNKTYDWDQVIQSPELFEEIERLTRAYPKAQEIIKKIMDAFGLDTSYYKHEGFSNLGDSILDSLKSADGSIEDWSKEQGKKMAEQMAQAYIDATYGSDIKRLNEAWQKALDLGDTNAMKVIERDLKTLYQKMADDPRLQEFIAKFKELADNPFKDMAKEFTQSLMDMEQTTEDFGLSIARNLTEQMIDKIIGDSYQAQIDALGTQWAEALKNGDTAAIERIKQEMMSLRDQMGEAVQPLLDAIKEIDEQTDTTFKDMTDSWVSALMDMDKTAEDWAQEVGKMMAQKIITEMVAPLYIQPLLNAMQKAFNDAMAVEGATFKSVMSAMTPFIEDIKEKFDEIRPIIEEIFGGFGIVTEAVEEVEEAVDDVEYALGDLKSEFSSALMDMESTAESFSKNIKNILAKTFVEKFILGDKFDAMMEQWQQQFEGILTGSMSDDQRKKSIQKLADSMTDYEQSLVGPVMSLLEGLGLTAESNQEATMNMADKITYDQADQLLGINIAQELTLEQILAEIKGGAVIQTSPYKLPVSTVTNDDGDEQLTATLLSMIDLTRIGNDNILSQFTMANDHLRMIQEYQRKINNEVSTHLASIDMKLNNLSRL